MSRTGGEGAADRGEIEGLAGPPNGRVGFRPIGVIRDRRVIRRPQPGKLALRAALAFERRFRRRLAAGRRGIGGRVDRGIDGHRLGDGSRTADIDDPPLTGGLRHCCDRQGRTCQQRKQSHWKPLLQPHGPKVTCVRLVPELNHRSGLFRHRDGE